MQYHKVTEEHIRKLQTILTTEQVLIEASQTKPYGSDYTEDLFYPPEVVVMPFTAKQVADVLLFCNENLIPVTPRGAGTGLSGGSLPLLGGISLTLEKMNKIIEIDLKNLQARVQPGVINQELRDAVEPLGLFYPPDPASKGSCFLGGNIAHASGGPRAVKYGTTKDYVLNLQVALPNGELIWTGADTLNFSTGYNLTQLMVGSEGTLGVVTEIVLKLIPFPSQRLLMLTRFENADSACAFIPEMMRKGITPSAMEFMETKAMQIASEVTGIPMSTDGVGAFVLIELDGNNQETLMSDCEQVYETLEKFGAGETEVAETTEQQEKFWKLRRIMGEAVKQNSIYKEEDTVVPRYELPKLFTKVKELEKKYGFQSVCYGHAGDGNLHVNILKNNLSEHEWKEMIPLAVTELFETCKILGGTISGEHGIGLVQKSYLPIVYSPTHIALMKGIKQVFDPKGILNPGKIFG
ncbi:MAG: FAD-binding protein [Bacteroidetes bacterium]|nr:FAD-binding protein [Bacteroidota bacterium]